MEFLLKSTTKEKGILILHVPLWIRLVLLCIGSIVLYALLIPVHEGSTAGFGVPGLVILILLFFGIFYEENLHRQWRNLRHLQPYCSRQMIY